MPSYILRELKRVTTLATIAVLVSMVSAPALLRAQQLIASNDTSAALSFADSAEKSLDNSTALPDAPQPAVEANSGQVSSSSARFTSPADPGTPPPPQTSRILGIMPNFRSVSANTQLSRQTASDKFLIAARDSFDYSSFLLAGIQAGFAMDSNSYPEFHQGVVGYGRYYWHTLADTANENFMVGGVGPALFHQDNRFYTLGHGSLKKRALYAATRVLITRKDDGRSDFNYSEIIGSGAASGISSLYYPTHDRTWTKVGQKWLTSDIIDAANFTFKEFWPDINRKIFHTH